MKTLLKLLPAVAILAVSCGDNESNKENYIIDFRPRECNYLFVVPGAISETTYQGATYIDFLGYPYDGYSRSEDFFLAIHTYNSDLRSALNAENGIMPYYYYSDEQDLDQPLVTIESQIEANYARSISRGSTLKSASDFTVMEEMEYRLDGVTDFNVYAVDTPLFGLEAGSSLNDYFRIVRYFPDFIASSQSHQLIYGFADRDKPAAIDEWLSLSSLAQPLMYLVFKEAPNDLPETIRFVVEMVTDKGTLLRDTIQVITFNR